MSDVTSDKVLMSCWLFGKQKYVYVHGLNSVGEYRGFKCNSALCCALFYVLHVYSVLCVPFSAFKPQLSSRSKKTEKH